jgi:hypothetical protein
MQKWHSITPEARSAHDSITALLRTSTAQCAYELYENFQFYHTKYSKHSIQEPTFIITNHFYSFIIFKQRQLCFFYLIVWESIGIVWSQLIYVKVPAASSDCASAPLVQLSGSENGK